MMNKNSMWIVGTLLAWMLAAVWSLPVAAAIVTAVPYELLPLGDSITRGFDSNERAYRRDLQTLLGASGYVMDFVGPLQHGDFADNDHAGYSGERIDEIDGRLDEIMGATPDNNPDVILLMIGTNDVFEDFDLANAPSRLSSLIGHIFDREPGAHLLVSTILPIFGNGNPDAVWEARVGAFNDALPGVVSGFAGTGRNISLLDLHALVGQADLPDGVHPDEGGNLKLAQGWFAGIQSITTVPLPSSLLMLVGGMSVFGGFMVKRRPNQSRL